MPHFEYPNADSGALKDGSYFAEDSYQLYSLGADGVADGEGLADNVTNWALDKPWRSVYRALEKNAP